jgi:excisionase family DNA binding protein
MKKRRPVFLSAAEAARALGVHVDTMRRWAHEKRFPCHRLGEKHSRLRISERAIMAYLESWAFSRLPPPKVPLRVICYAATH